MMNLDTQTLLQLADASWKITLLLGALLLVGWLLRGLGVSAARRASVAFVGALCVPLIFSAAFSVQAQRSLWTIEVETTAPQETKVSSAPVEVPAIGKAIRAIAAKLNPVEEPTAAAATVELPASRGANVALWVIGIWFSGALVALLRLVLGIVSLGRIPGERLRSGNLHLELLRACHANGISRIPALLIGKQPSAVPMTWGWRRHRILIPAEADSWTTARLRFVFQHELAHISRRDCSAGWAMRALLAPAWFHPLAWLLARQAGELRERACDDLVNAQLNERDQYAKELVFFSHCVPARAGGVAMARPHKMAERIQEMYAERLDRRCASGRSRLLSALALLAVTIPLLFVTACQTTKSTAESPKSTATKASFEPPRSEINVSPKAPIFFPPGEKRVVVRAFEIDETITPGDGIQFSGGALELIRAAEAKGESVLPAATMRKIFAKAQPEADTFSRVSAQPVELKIGQRYALSYSGPFPTWEVQNGTRLVELDGSQPETGVRINTRASELPSGTLSVTADFDATSGLVRKDSSQEIMRHKKSFGTMEIENGGGIILGTSGHATHGVTDHTSPLAIIPGLGKKYERSRYYKIRKILILSVEIK